MREERIIVFDMDGTLADTYAEEGWLQNLRAEKVDPFVTALPRIDIGRLNQNLHYLKSRGWKVIVVSWLPMNASRNFRKRCSLAKEGWLEKYEIPTDETHFLKYGTSKVSAVFSKRGKIVLFDDDKKVRDDFSNRKQGRFTFSANNINEILEIMIKKEKEIANGHC